jgi:hypothetical protein
MVMIYKCVCYDLPATQTKRCVMLWGAVCQWKTVAADAAEIHGKQEAGNRCLS